MLPKIHHRLPLIAILIGSAGLSLLQADTVKLQFLSFPQVPNAEPLQLLTGEGEALDVETPTNRLSRTYQVPRLSTWALGRLAETEEGLRFKVQGQVQSSGNDHQIVLLIRNPADEEDKFDMMVLGHGGKPLSGGEFFIMNFSKAEIGGVVGDKKFGLKAREHITISPSPDRLVGERKFAIATLFFKKGEKAEPFFTKQWRLSENANSMVFLYHDPNNDRLRLHTIRNFLP